MKGRLITFEHLYFPKEDLKLVRLVLNKKWCGDLELLKLEPAWVIDDVDVGQILSSGGIMPSAGEFINMLFDGNILESREDMNVGEGGLRWLLDEIEMG